MSGETEKNVSSWTTDSLKEFLATMADERAVRLQHEVIHAQEFNAEVTRRLDEKIEYEAKLSLERDKRYEQRFQAQEAATVYMRQVTNEFRGQLADQQSTFITRTETLARAQANADKIDALATRLDRTEGRSGMADPMLEAVMKEIASLRESRSQGAGEKTGKLSQQQFIAMMAGLFVSVVTIVSIIIAIAFAIRK